MSAISTKTKPISVTLPCDVIQKVKEIARSEDRSFSYSLTQIVRRATAHLQAEEPATSRV